MQWIRRKKQKKAEREKRKESERKRWREEGQCEASDDSAAATHILNVAPTCRNASLSCVAASTTLSRLQRRSLLFSSSSCCLFFFCSLAYSSSFPVSSYSAPAPCSTLRPVAFCSEIISDPISCRVVDVNVGAAAACFAWLGCRKNACNLLGLTWVATTRQQRGSSSSGSESTCPARRWRILWHAKKVVFISLQLLSARLATVATSRGAETFIHSYNTHEYYSQSDSHSERPHSTLAGA